MAKNGKKNCSYDGPALKQLKTDGATADPAKFKLPKVLPETNNEKHIKYCFKLARNRN